MATKEVIWLRLLLKELGLLQPRDTHVLIKISEDNTYAQTIYQEFNKVCKGRKDKENSSITISFISHNQVLVTLTNHLFFYSRIKQIDNHHYYIRDKVAHKRIELSIMPWPML